MRRSLKRAARVAVKGAAVVVDPLFGTFCGPRILIYHQVGVSLGREMEVSTQSFVEQLEWIQENGEIVDLETAIERRGEPEADRLFVLTFDDGFEDVYRNAFPHMRERGVPFTLYLTTRAIETEVPLDLQYPTARPLTWSQVNDMVESGHVTIGAHTHTHPDLRTVEEDRIREELDTSNKLIYQRTGVEPRHFTYPWGWWSAPADTLVRERYVSATIGTGVSLEPYTLSRIPVQRADRLFFFKRKIAGGLQLESRVREFIGNRGIR